MQEHLKEEPKEILMNFKLSRRLFNNLEAVCKKEFRTKSAVVRMLLQKYTQRYENIDLGCTPGLH